MQRRILKFLQGAIFLYFSQIVENFEIQHKNNKNGAKLKKKIRILFSNGGNKKIKKSLKIKKMSENLQKIRFK